MATHHSTNYSLFIIHCSLFIISLSACTAPIDLNTANSEPVIVIYGCLSEDSVYQTVRVTMSSPYFEVEPNKPVSNAIVSIQSSDNQVFELIETNEKGLYRTRSPMAAVVGTTYHLSVQADITQSGSMKLYEATTTMQHTFIVDSINIDERTIMGFKHFMLNIYAQEELGPDYYCAYAIVNDSLTTATISRYTVFSDFGIDGQYLDGMPLMQFEDIESNMNKMP